MDHSTSDDAAFTAPPQSGRVIRAAFNAGGKYETSDHGRVCS